MFYRLNNGTAAVALALLCVVLITSCGYSLRPNPAISEVRIGKIKNLTFEPALQDTFILALEQELTRLGVRVDRSAGHVVEGKITQVKVTGKVEENDVIVQYEISITGDFQVVTPEGKKLDLKGRDNFIVTFSGNDDLRRLMSSKEGAIEKALINLATDIASDIAANRGKPDEEAPADVPDSPEGGGAGSKMKSEVDSRREGP